MTPYDLSRPIPVRRMRARWPGDRLWHRLVLWRIPGGWRPFWGLQRWVYVEELTERRVDSVPHIDVPPMTSALTRTLERGSEEWQALAKERE